MSVHGAIFFPFLFVFEGFQRARVDYFWQYYFLGKGVFGAVKCMGSKGFYEGIFNVVCGGFGDSKYWYDYKVHSRSEVVI